MSFRKRLLPTFFVTAVTLAAACQRSPHEQPPAPAPSAASSAPAVASAPASAAPSSNPPHTLPPRASVPSPAARELVLLYTADEHGWMLPHEGKKGGAISLLHQWIKSEHYCVPDQPGACDDSPVFALSGGDNWTGPAISSYFRGKPMAETFRAIGYLAASMGNHELDFGQQNLIENARVQGYDFLSANIRWEPGHTPLPVIPWTVIRRNQVDIGVIGLSTVFTTHHLAPASYEGLKFEDEEQTLTRVVPEVWNAGVDLVLVVSHVCPDVMQHIVGKHPEWNIAFVGAAHCHALKALYGGKTPVYEAAAEETYYVRVPISVDLSRPPQQRVLKVEPQLVEIATMPSEAAMPEPVKRLNAQVMQAKAAVDDKLGEVIGYTQMGMRRESPTMVKWLLGAWRKQLGVDAVIMNKAGMRQDLASGDIRVSSLWDILPFSNRIVTMKLTGKDLIDNATCCDGLMSGIRKLGDNWVLADGRKVEPDATYRVMTPDYTFLGGNGFHFKSQAIEPEFGPDWRDTIADWMRANKTTRTRPLDLLVKP